MIIYLITNKVNGMRYVGQTRASKAKRWTGHCAAAKHGQKTVIASAIRKYGRHSFSMEIIDTADTLEELSRKEALHANRLGTYVPNGYNVQECGVQVMKRSQEAIDKRSKTYEFISPTGEKTTIKNLKAFCEIHQLDHCHMYHVAQGKRVAHKGWRTVKESHQVYIVENIDTGERKTVINAYGFKRRIAEEMGIYESALRHLINGKGHRAGRWRFVATDSVN